MSAVLHPVGPEPASTYWLRRVLVVGVLAVVVAVATALTNGGPSPQSAIPAAPASATSAVRTSPPGDASPSAENGRAELSPTPSPNLPTSRSTRDGSATSTPSASRTRNTSPDRSAASSSPSSSATTSSSPTPESQQTRARRTPTSSPTSESGKAASPSAGSDPSRAAAQLCDPAILKPTLTGHRRPAAGKPSTFHLSLTNDSDTTCSVSVNAEDFELKITSGADEIWTTGDCAASVPSIDQTVASRESVQWTMTWNGQGSTAGCRSRPEALKRGSYVAWAQLEGGSSVRLRMTVAGTAAAQRG